jgi:4-alpha-glucanotransferase
MYETDNCVVYTASHDSDCTASWCKTLKGEAKKIFNAECPSNEGESRTESVIRLAMSSRADLCVITMQDYLELTNAKGRMNTPSVATGNWQWRLDEKLVDEALTSKIKTLTESCGRA